jgi:alpha-1,2-mannosyltransferase
MVMPGALALLLDAAMIVVGALGVRHVATRPWPPRRIAFGVAAICASAFAFVFMISEPHARFADLRRAYYPAGAAVLQDHDLLTPLIERGVHGFVNLPIVAYLFAPFGALPWQVAAVAFLAVGLLLTLAAWHALTRSAGLDRESSYLLLFLIAAAGPVAYSLREGNTSHMVLLGLVGGLELLRRGHRASAGALLAFMAVVKLPLMLFGIYFVLRRNWRAASGFSGICAAAALASLAVFGWEMNLLWFERCVLQFASNPLGAFNVQSLQALVVRVVEGPGVLRQWDAFPIDGAQRLVGSLLGGLLYLAAVAACLVRRGSVRTEGEDGQRMTLEYLIVVCLAVLGSPLSWTHYYAWLMLPVAYLLARPSLIVAGPSARRLAWLGILLIMPAVLLPDLSGTVQTIYGAIGVSLPLFGGLIIYGLVLHATATLGQAADRRMASTWENHDNGHVAEPG